MIMNRRLFVRAITWGAWFARNNVFQLNLLQSGNGQRERLNDDSGVGKLLWIPVPHLSSRQFLAGLEGAKEY